MLSYLRDENRCYLMVTTIVSLGVAYIVNKLFSAVYPKKGNLKQIELDDKETCNDDLKARNDITDIKEALNVTECLSEDLKLYSKSENLYKVLDLLVDRSEQTILPFNKSESDEQTQPSKNSTSEAILTSKTLPRIVSSGEALASEIQRIESSETPTPEPIPSSEIVLSSKANDLPSDMVQTSKLNNLQTEVDPTNEFDKSSSEVNSIIKNDNLQSEEVATSNIDILSSKSDPSLKLNNLESEEVSSTNIEILSSEADPAIELNNLPSEKISTSTIDIFPLEVEPSFEPNNLQSEEVSTSKLQVLPLNVDPTSTLEILSSDKSLASELELLASETSSIRDEILPPGSPTSDLKLSLSKTSGTELENLITECEMLSSKTQTSKHKTADMNIVLLKNNCLEEKHDEFQLEVPVIESQVIEKEVSILLESLLQESKIASVSFKANNILEISSQNHKDRVNIEPSIEKENLSSNEQAENEDSYVNLECSETVEFPLDTIPLEMIYQVLPLSMR